MTLAEIKALIVSADPDCARYESAYAGGAAYTVWREVRRLPAMSDDAHDEGWVFQVDRFTKAEDDAVALAIYGALTADDRVAFSYSIDYEQDTGYVHHIFDCEGY